MKRLLYGMLCLLFFCCAVNAQKQKVTAQSIDSFLNQIQILVVEVVPAPGNLGLKGKKMPFRMEVDLFLDKQKRDYKAGDSVQVRYDIWNNNVDSGDWVFVGKTKELRVGTTNDPFTFEYYKGVVIALRSLTEEEKNYMRQQIRKENE